MKLMRHQEESLKFMEKKKEVFDMSDPGCGKTAVEIFDFLRQWKKDKKAMLVVCPKSLMRAAWYNDIAKFAPQLRVSLCYATNRNEALSVDADVYVINVDGVKNLAKITDKKFWKKFGRLVIDESTAYKHHTSQRSKAIVKIRDYFEWVRLMSGTAACNGICDIWHQTYILDKGRRLGKSFFGFRSACCTPEQTGPSVNHLKWVDKEGIELTVAELIKDITIRHKFEDCVDIPENHQYAVRFQLSDKHMAVYKELKDNQIALVRETTISAINAAVLATKLLQAASGAVYSSEKSYAAISSERYELAIDMVEEREHSIVFYQWDHQRDELVKEAKKRKIAHAVWDPDTPEIADQFQQGSYQVLFAHPASAGHGLTLTKGTATIWVSPTYNLEHFLQGLKRVHRIGQKMKTETIAIVAEDTVDEKVFDALINKNVKLTNLLSELE